MRRIGLFILAAAAAAFLMAVLLPGRSTAQPPLAALRARFQKKEKASIDHTRFAQLKQKFTRPQEVTAACISCHNGRHREVMQSSHWSWERLEYIQGKGIRPLGKKNALNNFCIGIAGNEPSCNKCHAGYGWADPTFDFQDPLLVDCLACHDNSNLYVKASGAAGMPDPAIDLSQVAQQVGRPQRTNCGTCHFFGGGGNNVKHGDLEKSLFDPSRDLDVHMASSGPDMQCVDCHTARQHRMLGKMYSISSMNRDRVECETCHGTLPHVDDVVNRHTLKVACQTCHIPEYAKEAPTKLTWDWSTAGRLKDGKPYEVKDANGVETYSSIKGSFTWGKKLKPEYVWFNGTAGHYMFGDPIDPGQTVKINELYGSYEDPDSKIVPVKVHRARQIYDTRFKYLIQPKTVSTQAGDGGFWKEFDWQKAASEGMKRIDLPFSGSYGFVNTEMVWPVNHMISSRERTVGCAECHTRQQGRLAALKGFYLPGRDYHPWVETFGTALIGLTLAGVLVHGSARVFFWRRRRRQ